MSDEDIEPELAALVRRVCVVLGPDAGATQLIRWGPGPDGRPELQQMWVGHLSGHSVWVAVPFCQMVNGIVMR